MRPEPLVITTKLMISRMANRITPITTSLPIRNDPNAATTRPAALRPSLPWPRINRVVATFSDSRNKVVSSSMVGKLDRSSGRRRKIATISINTDMVMDTDRPKSSNMPGSGTINTATISTTPNARPISAPGVNLLMLLGRPGNPNAMIRPPRR